MKKWIVIGVSGLLLLLTGCSQKKEEIIWYISDPEFYGVDSKAIKPYQEVESKRFELFNERLEEMGISTKVTFKYMPRWYEATEEDFEEDRIYEKELGFSANHIKRLLEKDSDADIVGFQPLEYNQFLVLDSYLEKEENKKVFQTLPSASWENSRINGEFYQIPKGNVSIGETVYCFYRPFVEQYKIALDEAAVTKMSPKEVIEYLLPYFEKDRVIDDKYYLTSSGDLMYMNAFQHKYKQIITNSYEWNIAVDLEKGQVVSILDTPEMKEALQTGNRIYRENIDAHLERKRGEERPVFRIETIPTIKELTKEQNEEWIRIPLENQRLQTSLGNGVLKESDEKELAVQVLAATMYDEELSNLMIYGILDQDYELKNGYAFYKERKMVSSMGSFSGIGNNLLAYPNELEVKEKFEVTNEVVKKVKKRSYNNFTPLLSQELLQKLIKINKIYWEISKEVGNSDIQDLDAYIEKQKIKLKEAGVEEVLEELQSQLENWKE